MAGVLQECVTTLPRLGTALVLGSIIGFERQWHQKMAGLRTNALVSVGAAGFVSFSALVIPEDPTRVAAQVVSGIGFLGAGVILREGINVHGLNTAATLWCSAMVGTFAGGGYYGPSVIAAGFIVLSNWVMRPVVRRMNQRLLTSTDVETHYVVHVTCRGADEARMRSLLLQGLSETDFAIGRIDSADIPETTTTQVTAHVSAMSRRDAALERVMGRLSLEPFVTAAGWEIFRSVPEA